PRFRVYLSAQYLHVCIAEVFNIVRLLAQCFVICIDKALYRTYKRLLLVILYKLDDWYYRVIMWLCVAVCIVTECDYFGLCEQRASEYIVLVILIPHTIFNVTRYGVIVNYEHIEWTIVCHSGIRFFILPNIKIAHTVY